VVPIETVTGFGLNALEPSPEAPLGIDTLDVDPDGVGIVGVGDVGDADEEFPPQPVMHINTIDTRLIRNRSMSPPSTTWSNSVAIESGHYSSHFMQNARTALRVRWVLTSGETRLIVSAWNESKGQQSASKQ